MTEILACACGYCHLDPFEVRLLWNGVHATNSCDLNDEEESRPNA